MDTKEGSFFFQSVDEIELEDRIADDGRTITEFNIIIIIGDATCSILIPIFSCIAVFIAIVVCELESVFTISLEFSTIIDTTNIIIVMRETSSGSHK